MQKLTVALSITLISIITGCSSKDAMLPKPDQSMLDVYNQHANGANESQLYDSRSLIRRTTQEDDVHLSDYVRMEKNQLESKFKTIPNPTLYMFVSPHLASDTQVPIPGYLTEFTMWEKTHYALPGEISDMSSAFKPTMDGDGE